MKRPVLITLIIATALSMRVGAAQSRLQVDHVWTYRHTAPQVSEIPAFDPQTDTLWVAGIVGVDVLAADSGALVAHIDVTKHGFVNSVAIFNGLAALAIEAAPGVNGATSRTNPGKVLFYDTRTLAPAAGNHEVAVGALPDMLTFTHDGSRLLVANEATPDAYGARIGTSVPRVYGNPAGDPAGAVTIIDVETRTVIATAGFVGVPRIGDNIRVNTGMDFEPEYITVSQDGTVAYVTLQEANAIAVLDLTLNAFTKIVGLGVKDFSLPGNEIDPNNDPTSNPRVSFKSYNVKGLYMPDSIASYGFRGETYLVMANEGDFREDDGDRSTAGSSPLSATGDLANLRVSNTDSAPATASPASPAKLYAAGARSFSIRNTSGEIVYDSGSILDREANNRGVYDDGRSRDKGVEPEGVALASIEGRTYAFIGLERTLQSTVAVFDVTDPTHVEFLDMIVTKTDLAPEGLAVFKHKGQMYLAIANETPSAATGTSNTTVYQLDITKK